MFRSVVRPLRYPSARLVTRPRISTRKFAGKEAEQKTGLPVTAEQKTTPQPATKKQSGSTDNQSGSTDRIWDRLSEVENRFADLSKDFYERFALLKAANKLVGWQLSAFWAAAATAIGAIVWVADHFPDTIAAILLTKNIVVLAPPTEVPAPAPAPAPAPTNK